MENNSIQKDASVGPPRGPVDDFDQPLRRFSRETLEKDKHHLKTLSIFFYVMSGLSCLGIVLGILYIPLGLYLIQTVPEPPNGPGPLIGYVFLGTGAFSLVLQSTYACLLFLCARSLRAYKRRMLIFVMACLLCANFPGIILGVFTIVVLSRESVKELFRYGDPSPYGIEAQ